MASISSILPYLHAIPFLLLSSPTTTPLHLISAVFDTDALHLTLGSQSPLNAAQLNNGEFPACAAMTTGYVFRVENEATVHFLQSIGTTGALTHLKVSGKSTAKTRAGLISDVIAFIGIWLGRLLAAAVIFGLLFGDHSLGALFDTVLVGSLGVWVMFSRGGQQAPVTTAVLSSVMNFCIAMFMHEIFGPAKPPSMSFRPSSTAFDVALCSLFASRVIFAYVLSRRTRPGWYGAAEPGVKGSLLVLLSRDRWVRLDGDVDDLKPVTSGAWLQPATALQDVLSQVSCLLVWMTVLVGLAAQDSEKVVLVLTVLVRHVVTAWSVRQSQLIQNGFMMQGKKVEIDISKGEQGVKRYGRRLEMAEELIKEFGRRDWAEQTGMVRPENGGPIKEVIM